MGNEMGNATRGSAFDAYRDQLARLLDLVDEENLSSVDRDALATGIRVARGVGDTLTLPNLQRQQPRAFDFGERILRQLADADEDEELPLDGVVKLEALVRDRLPETL